MDTNQINELKKILENNRELANNKAKQEQVFREKITDLHRKADIALFVHLLGLIQQEACVRLQLGEVQQQYYLCPQHADATLPELAPWTQIKKILTDRHIILDTGPIDLHARKKGFHGQFYNFVHDMKAIGFKVNISAQQDCITLC